MVFLWFSYDFPRSHQPISNAYEKNRRRHRMSRMAMEEGLLVTKTEFPQVAATTISLVGTKGVTGLTHQKRMV